MPSKVISFPGIRCCGSLIHSSSVWSFHTMSDDLRAGEYRLKLSKPPAFLFHKFARLGPVMFLSGCKEWQAAHAPNTRGPRGAFPLVPAASNTDATASGAATTAISRKGSFIFMVDL